MKRPEIGTATRFGTEAKKAPQRGSENAMEVVANPTPTRSSPGAARAGRSAVTNGKRLHVVRPGDTAWARRFRDVLAEITNDLGGADLLSEGQRQLARRAATISIVCERMEGDTAAGNPIDLDVYGTLTDRLGRTFHRLGLKRQARPVESLQGYLARKYPKSEGDVEAQ
jgi:hypothetical protein